MITDDINTLADGYLKALKSNSDEIARREESEYSHSDEAHT